MIFADLPMGSCGEVPGVLRARCAPDPSGTPSLRYPGGGWLLRVRPVHAQAPQESRCGLYELALAGAAQ